MTQIKQMVADIFSGNHTKSASSAFYKKHINNKMSQFEQHIKQALENYEAQYNPADWADMQNRLNKAKAGKSKNIGKGLIAAASVAAVGGLIYYFTSSHVENKSTPVAVSTQRVIVKNETPVKQEQNNNTPTPAPVQKNESTARKVIAENNPIENKNKSTAPANTVHSVNNTVENKTSVQEPVPPSTINLQPSTIAVLTASFHPEMNKVCEGAAVKFVPDNNGMDCTYKWYFSDGSSSVEQSPAHIFAEAGTYSVKLRVVSAKDKKQADQKNMITVIAAPSVQVNYSVSDDNNLLVNFDADGDKVVEWKWNFGDKQSSSQQNPSHTYSKKGNYKAELTVKNSAGCSAVSVKDVNLKNELNLLAPNAFSPDGNGINDTWMPAALLSGDYIFTLTIFDKSGNKVFQTSDKNHPWDGQGVKSGDTFKWSIVVKDKNGEVISCKDQGQGLITITE